MKERPILFSGPMVRAILDGRKTQTRRVVKSLRHPFGHLMGPDGVAREFRRLTVSIQCPYGQPGDQLWVKETWNVVPVGRPAPLCGTAGIPTSLPEGWGVMYQASGDVTTKLVGWRPSIHMPRWASRITLEITGVRVERLQYISPRDALAEEHGTLEHLIETYNSNGVSTESYVGLEDTWIIHEFASLWSKIHSPESWSANPWVWVIEFKRLEGLR